MFSILDYYYFYIIRFFTILWVDIILHDHALKDILWRIPVVATPHIFTLKNIYSIKILKMWRRAWKGTQSSFTETLIITFLWEWGQISSKMNNHTQINTVLCRPSFNIFFYFLPSIYIFPDFSPITPKSAKKVPNLHFNIIRTLLDTLTTGTIFFV